MRGQSTATSRHDDARSFFTPAARNGVTVDGHVYGMPFDNWTQLWHINTALFAKAGLIAMSKSLAQEVGSRGITVNVVAPGFVATAMTRGKGIKGSIPADEVARRCLAIARAGGSMIAPGTHPGSVTISRNGAFLTAPPKQLTARFAAASAGPDTRWPSCFRSRR